MSDERSRHAERKWRTTGATDDEAAWLLERVRIGALSADRLQLAAYSGHVAAMVATQAKAPTSSMRGWVIGLQKWAGTRSS